MIHTAPPPAAGASRPRATLQRAARVASEEAIRAAEAARYGYSPGPPELGRVGASLSATMIVAVNLPSMIMPCTSNVRSL